MVGGSISSRVTVRHSSWDAIDVHQACKGKDCYYLAKSINTAHTEEARIAAKREMQFCIVSSIWLAKNQHTNLISNATLMLSLGIDPTRRARGRNIGPGYRR